MDWAHEQSDEDLANLIERIQRIYKRALRETTKKLNNFSASFYLKDKQKQIDVQNGLLAYEEYIRWRKGQYFIQGRWQSLVDELAVDLANADTMAMTLVSENMVNTYVKNYNYGLFDVDQKARVNVSFTAYDRNMVLRLIKDNPNFLPMPDPEKAALYNKVWHTDRITEEITQSILQGEDLHQLADRFEKYVGMDRNAAIRNARTLTTTAENKARLDSYMEAEASGTPMFKQWVATEDERTRASHMAIHFQVKPLSEPFDNGLMYPGDTSTGNGAEFYNCRCRLIANPYGINPAKPHDVNLKNLTGGRGYNQWVKEHLEHG